MKQTWTIGEMAKLFDVSTDTLRYYEKEGLLHSDRNSENGYRYYSYDDLFVFMDILLFRSLGVAVKEIQPLVTTKKLGEIKDILKHNDHLIEKKIEALTRQRAQLAQIIVQHEVCEEQLGKFSIVPAPSFKSKFLGIEVEEMFQVIRRYKLDQCWMQNIRYTLLLSPEDWFNKRSFDVAQMGISFADEIISKFDFYEQQEFSSLPKKDCLYTVLGTDYSNREHDVLIQASVWLTECGRQAEGPLLGRYLASSHKEGFDYYEIWLGLLST
ncbi:MAG: transcriptional regulator, MerR family [Firmicutes bacterium]|nr:transcriptional regulator, MerR family [Bacillota bacterium]